jgi:hypothetical protein
MPTSWSDWDTPTHLRVLTALNGAGMSLRSLNPARLVLAKEF